jgi:UDP-N-acetylmuramoylalanine--D-glutamate ligase
VLIAGGVHKGASYTDWAGPLKAKAVGVCLFGQAKDLIAQDLHFEGVKCTIYDNLEKAVEQAYKQLEEKGGNVLFSPGCSSFDMFKNFEERGERFRESIHELKAGGLHDKTRHDHQCSTN